MGLRITVVKTPDDAVAEILGAIKSVVNGGNVAGHSRNEVSLDDMDYESTSHCGPGYAPAMSSYSLQFSNPSPSSGGDQLLTQMIPPILRSKGGLADVPQDTLRENLRPIVQALRKLDAKQLLSLQPSHVGPQLCEGHYCRPIHDEVIPAVECHDPSAGKSCVRYLHISEVPDQYSIGIFVFAPFARIPLHDHPGMCVLSRVLYGDLKRMSLDLARTEDIHSAFTGLGDAFKRSNSQDGWSKEMDFLRRELPRGSKLAYKNHVDHLQAPDVTVLYPFEGNLHEFVAGPSGAAVLDVLLPPYDNVQNRDCTFYQVQSIPSNWPQPEGKEPCFIVPTGQPESFHCISGQYRDIGESDN